jgi:hypothetical protein
MWNIQVLTFSTYTSLFSIPPSGKLKGICISIGVSLDEDFLKLSINI